MFIQLEISETWEDIAVFEGKCIWPLSNLYSCLTCTLRRVLYFKGGKCDCIKPCQVRFPPSHRLLKLISILLLARVNMGYGLSGCW